MNSNPQCLFKVLSQTPTSYNSNPFCSFKPTTMSLFAVINKSKQLHSLHVLNKNLPLLIVPYDQKNERNPSYSDTLGFISLFHDDYDDELNKNKNKNKNKKNKEVCKLHVPEIEDRRICGSSEGWLVTVHENGEIQLLNPCSKVLVHLPPLTAFPEVVAKFISEEIAGPSVPKDRRGLCYLVSEESIDTFVIHDSHHFREFFLDKLVTNTTTTDTTDANSTTVVPTVVMAIYGCYDKLAFCRPTVVMAIYGCSRKLSFCSPTGNGIDDDEQNKWIASFEGDKGGWQDVTFYKGNFYAVRFNGTVVVVKGLDGPSPFVETIIEYDPENDDYVYVNYLVEYGGDLLKVMRDVENEEGCPYRTIKFSVMKLDFNGPKWVEVTNLSEDCALFIGYNHSFSFSASKFPGCRGNCIYFTDNNSELFYNNPYGGHDMGVYNLEDGSFEKLYETTSSSSSQYLIMPPPFWYVPN